MIRVAVLPDWRRANPYQDYLGRALAAEGIETIYPAGYRRGLPLFRGSYHNADLLHLHWPEAYFGKQADGLGWFRRLRFPLDLRLATRRRPLVYTAHNLRPHQDKGRAGAERNYRSILRTAAGIIAHSQAAADQVAASCPGIAPVIHVIPHGDLAEHFPALPLRDQARSSLRLPPEEPMALVFGRVEPYKGLEELVAAWPHLRSPARLWIAGSAKSPEFAARLRAMAAGSNARVSFDLDWMTDEQLAVRLAAADITLFNYRNVLTSGAACLARSLGKKIVLPAHLDTVDLHEPASTVFRFANIDSDLATVLERALAAPSDPQGTAAWRQATSWRLVARKTAAVYEAALAVTGKPGGQAGPPIIPTLRQ